MSDLFEQIAQVWEGSKEITTKTKPESVFMTARFISLTLDGFTAAQALNMKGTVPPWLGLPFLKFTVPNRKAPRNVYPKQLAKQKLNEKQQRSIELICCKFNVNEFHGMQIKKLLDAQGFKTEGS